MPLENNDYIIVNTTSEDHPAILRLFQEAMEWHGQEGYKVWASIDVAGLQKDIDQNLQFKIVSSGIILAIFSIQLSDPFIWRGKDHNNAVYLHRIVVDTRFKGQKLFAKILNWACDFARKNKLTFIRMDTWADNSKIINYYQTFGFEFIEYYQTPDVPELPVQNRNLKVALLEMRLQEI